ncbi:MAG: hypothetical protein PVI90_00280 [Desulfobacteraceae bacterium]|jgi:hypothetical protein
MEIRDIMRRLDASRADTGIKTAAAVSEDTKATTDPETLRNALRDAVAAAPAEVKTASIDVPQNPADDLLKLAEDLTSAEEDAMQKKAAVYGAAMCDGFMARFSQYEDAALQTPNAKTAQIQSQTQDIDLNAIKTAAANDPEFQKFATENPALVKEAVDLGYRQTWDNLVKTAREDLNQGYNDTMTEIHKLASDCYKQGAITINNVLREMQNQAA